MVGGDGFEPPRDFRQSDLQSDAILQIGKPPKNLFCNIIIDVVNIYTSYHCTGTVIYLQYPYSEQ